MLSAAVIADDLTGAADCAAAFAAAGGGAFVALGDSFPPSIPVVAWDTDSRAVAPQAAAARVEAAACRALGAGARVVYKKIDSTLRGHVGAEVAALFRVATAGGDRAIVIAAPSVPAQGRTLSGGCVHVDGVPLAEAGGDRRPGGSCGSGDLTALLSAAGLHTVRASTDALRAGALDLDADAIVCDAADEADLRRIAGLGAALPFRVLWAGSGGLARHLPGALGLAPAGPAPARLGAPAGPLLLLVGSRSQAARAQAKVLCAEPGIQRFELDPGALLAGADRTADASLAGPPARALEAGCDVVLLIGQRGAVDPGAGPALAAALGKLAAPLAAKAGGLLATGGETARAALLALGARGIHLAGEVEPGVPLGILEAPRRLPIVTKAGSFGDAATLSRCRATLKGGRS
ncbi:MAG: four-carbon acid sugar kinase family protein [Myxococcales bacterium]